MAVVDDEPGRSHSITTVLARAGLLLAGVARAPEDRALRHAHPEPEVVVLGCDLSEHRATRTLRVLAERLPDARVVVVSPRPRGGANLRSALNAGAAGIVFEQELEAALAATVTVVAAGQCCVPSNLRRCVVRPAFSHREKQILSLVVMGFQNAEIARRLFLAESTVKGHLVSSFKKLGVSSRKEAATVLLDPDEGLAELLAVDPTEPPAWAATEARRPVAAS